MRLQVAGRTSFVSSIAVLATLIKANQTSNLILCDLSFNSAGRHQQQQRQPAQVEMIKGQRRLAR